MSITGEPGRGPMRVGTALADLSAGVFAAMGILVALHERERSGRGQWVQTSLLQAQIFMLDFQAARYLIGGRSARAGRQRSSDRRADRRLQHQGRLREHRAHAGDVAAVLQGDRPRGPDRASELRDAEKPARAPRCAQCADRRDHRDDDDRRADRAAQQGGIPCGPIYSIDQTFADPQVQHLGIAQAVPSSALGTIELVGQPFTLSRTPSRMVSGAPEFGEQTERFCARSATRNRRSRSSGKPARSRLGDERSARSRLRQCPLNTRVWNGSTSAWSRKIKACTSPRASTT